MISKFIFYSLFLFALTAFSQQKDGIIKIDTTKIIQKKFDAKSLEKYKSKKEFNYKEAKKELTFIDKVLNWLWRQILRFFEWIFGVKYAKGILAKILMVLPYVIGGIVLFLLIKFFVKTKIKSAVSFSKNPSIINFSKDEELLQKADLEALIKNAIDKEDYRLAVRFLYLKTLKLLTDNKFVNWEQQKTNNDYISEIIDTTLKKSFENTTRIYDFVWYGNFQIDYAQFSRIYNEFSATNSLINPQKNG
jgi:hypothetical protein